MELHPEMVPIWVWVALGTGVLVAAVWTLYARWRESKARERRQRRYRRNRAYARAWDWIMRSKARRLTDQRDRHDSVS